MSETDSSWLQAVTGSAQDALAELPLHRQWQLQHSAAYGGREVGAPGGPQPLRRPPGESTERIFLKSFVNELGNSIDMAVQRRPRSAPTSIEISVLGPDSLTENAFTPMEAGHLVEGLIEVLKPASLHGRVAAGVSRALLIVEDASTAEAMQRFISSEALLIRPMFCAPTAERFKAAYVRWPTANWFDRFRLHDRPITEQTLQDWVRQTVSSWIVRGGDFQYI